MRFFVSADETGNIKEVVCTRGTDTLVKDGQKPEKVQNLLQKNDFTTVKTRISHLATFQEKWLLALRRGGLLSVHEFFGSSETPEENYLHLHTYQLEVEEGDRPVSLVPFPDHDFAVVAFESAKVFVVYFHAGKFDVVPLKFDLPPRQTEKPSSVSCFVANPYIPGVFAYGGKDNDVQVVRLFKSDHEFTEKSFSLAGNWKLSVLFKARNVEPDHLGLEVPIWVTNVLFMAPEGDTKKKFRLVASSHYGHIRKYNTAEDKEPILSYKVCDTPIISLAFASTAQDEIIVCDTHTFVAKLSLTQTNEKGQKIISASAGTFHRPTLKLLGKFSEGGNTGAVHGVDVSLTLGLVAFGGLDRYLRVFDLKSRKMVLKVYLGTQISSVKMLDATDGDESNEVKDAEDDEDFWNGLEEGKTSSSGAPVLKKRKRNI